MLKTNIKFLRDINEAMAEIAPALAAEAIEFLDAIENESGDGKINELEDRISELEKENEKLLNNIDDNISFVGLDTIFWRLENDNLLIKIRMKAFIKALQKENAVVPA